MNIEQMAREAGCTYKIGESFVHFGLHDGVPMPWLERFAALVRAQALEEAAKVCDGKERRKWEILTTGGTLECFGPLDCARGIRALKG